MVSLHRTIGTHRINPSRYDHLRIITIINEAFWMYTDCLSPRNNFGLFNEWYLIWKILYFKVIKWLMRFKNWWRLLTLFRVVNVNREGRLKVTTFTKMTSKCFKKHCISSNICNKCFIKFVVKKGSYLFLNATQKHKKTNHCWYFYQFVHKKNRHKF